MNSEINSKIREMQIEMRQNLNEAKKDLETMHEDLEDFKSRVYENCSHDEELDNLVSCELGESCAYFVEENGTPEQQDEYEKIYNEYFNEVESTLEEISSFKEAMESSYLMTRDSDYAKFIETGERLEIFVEKLEEFLSQDY